MGNWLKFRRLGILLGTTAILVLCATSSVWAVDGWSAKTLTPSPSGQKLADMDGNYLIYEEPAGEARTQVHLADLATGVVTKVTDAPYTCTASQISGGYVVYEGEVGPGNTEIFLYEIASAKTTRITTNDYPDRTPELADGYVTWVGEVGPVYNGSDEEIFLYNIASKTTTQITRNDRVDSDPRVSDGRVVWRGLVGDEMEVFAYDIASAQTTKLSQDSTSNRDASVSGNFVAWAGNGKDGSPAVFLYDLETKETKTLPAARHAAASDLELSGSLLTWVSFIPGAYGGVNVFDTVSGKTTTFTAEFAQVRSARASDGRVVWREYDFHDDEIFAGDLQTGIASQLTNNGTNDWNPATANGWVAWEDYSAGRAQIMVASTNEDPSAPFVDVAGSMRSRSAIVALAEGGALSGYETQEGAEFRPGSPLLRAQLAKMLVLALDIPVSEGETSPFTDMGPNDPTSLYPHDYVAAAYQAGVIRGTSATTFSPWQTTSRGQAISLAVRYVEKTHPGSLPWPHAGEYALSDEYPGIHTANIRVAFYNGLLGGVLTGDSGWNPWLPITRAQAAQILLNASEYEVASPRPTENFYAERHFTSLDDLNAYIAQQRALLNELAAAHPREPALVSVTFTRPVPPSELARIEADYGLEPYTRELLFQQGSSIVGGGEPGENALDFAKRMQGFEPNMGEPTGYLIIEVWAPLEVLSRLQQEDEVRLVDPWQFFQEMRDGQRQGLEVTAGSYPPVYYYYQRFSELK